MFVVDWCVLVKKHRGKGIARALVSSVINATEKFPDSTRPPNLFLWCEEHLIPFYKSFGFSAFIENLNYPRVPEPLTFMSRPIPFRAQGNLFFPLK